MRKIIYLLVIFAMVACFSKVSTAAEHPGEHPGTKVEHHEEEHPGEEISADGIRKAIESYAKNDSKLKGGYFLLYDSKDKNVLQLQFVRVHERVSFIKKESAYFACADFKTIDGKTAYDLDFWMKESHHGELEVYKIMVHKKDGNPRFTYSDDEIVPVESEHMAPEQNTGQMAPEQHS